MFEARIILLIRAVKYFFLPVLVIDLFFHFENTQVKLKDKNYDYGH